MSFAQTGTRSGGRPPAATAGSGDNLPHTIYVVGKVAMADGTAPPAKVAIVSVCDSNTRKETITQPDGSFSFMLGDRNSSVMQDASNAELYSGSNSSMTSNAPGSASTQFDTRTLQNCELHAELQGYQSSHAAFPGMPSGTVNMGVLTLRSQNPKDDAVISVTSLQAPSKARKELEKGKAQLEKGKANDAAASLQKAVEEYPQYAEAWYLLGNAQSLKKDATGARASYQAAQKADPSYAPPYLPLARAAAQARQWEDVLSLTNQLIALEASKYPIAYYYNAMANYNLKNLDKAEGSALMGESLDKAHGEPRIEILLGMIYTAKQNYVAATRHYRNYLQIVPDGPLTAQVKSDLAKCEEMAKANGTPETSSKP